MNNNYPVEALLRPPIELWSVLCAYGTATIAIMAPWSLMMTPAVGYGTAAMLFLFGSIRTKDAFYVLRYQRNMRKLPEYSLTPDQLPVSYRRLFLGRGFLWQQKHTQRLRDTLSPKVRNNIINDLFFLSQCLI